LAIGNALRSQIIDVEGGRRRKYSEILLPQRKCGGFRSLREKGGGKEGEEREEKSVAR
jgi:hypothetical protein